MLTTIHPVRLPGTRKAHDQMVTTCCQECTAGCGLQVYVKDDRIVDVQGDEQHPISRGRLCARGIAFAQGLTHTDRITNPATRDRLTAHFEAFDNSDKAFDQLAERIRRISDKHGPDAVAIGCDPEAGLDYYLGAQRFAKLLGTPHLYHPLAEASDDQLPMAMRRPSIPSTEWSQARSILLIEADLAGTHPVTYARVLEAQRQGAKIIALDTRYGATLAQADRALQINPSTGNALGLVLMKLLIEENLVSSQTLADTMEDAEAWMASFDDLSLDDVEAGIGLSLDEIRSVALMLGRHQPAVIVTGKRLALSENYGIWSAMARAMGWNREKGGGWYPLESGAPELDVVGDLADVAPKMEGEPLAGFSYHGAGDIRIDPENNKIKAIIGSGNCLSDFLAPFGPLAKDLELVVYFGSYPNETRELAHMVFPAAAWAERDGLSFNDDGAVQWSPHVVAGGDACCSGLGFWMRLAKRFGWEEHFPWLKANEQADHAAFYKWTLKRSQDTKAIDADALVDSGALQYWRQQEAAAPSEKGEFLTAPKRIGISIKAEDAASYPLNFQATRTAVRGSDASGWWPWTSELQPVDTVQVNPETAQALAIENGEIILVSSAEETVEGQACINRMVPPRMVWSCRRMNANRVLIQRRGQSREEARDLLKAIGL